MQFIVKELSYLFGNLVPAGATFDYPDDKLPRNADGSVNLSKMSKLEPVNPEEAAATNAPADIDTGASREEAIKAVVDALDKANNDHWTADGKPNLNHIASVLGFKVSRAQVEAVAPGFVRPAE